MRHRPLVALASAVLLAVCAGVAPQSQTAAGAGTPSTPSYRPARYAATDLQALYSTAQYQRTPSPLSPLVAIVDPYGYSQAEQDLAKYRSSNGLPACTSANGCFTKIDQRGGSSFPAAVPAGSNWDAETALDLDAVSAVCPACRILLVVADSESQALPAVQTAVAFGARYVSMSFDFPESQITNFTPAGAAYWDKTYFSAPGVTYVAASGDGGYEDGANHPASSPNVVAVGGVSVARNAATTPNTFTGSVWFGAGSGCSSAEPKPSYQAQATGAAAAAATTCPGRRAVADLSAMAYDQNESGFASVFNGKVRTDGVGTSLAAPIIAAMYALTGTTAGSASGAVQRYAYTHPDGFADITSGNNILGPLDPDCHSVLCDGAVGWDAPTGMGMPISPASLWPITPVLHDPALDAAPASLGASTVAPGMVAVAAKLDTRAWVATAAPITYRASGLPAGTRISTNGYIVGKPAKAGTYRVTVAALAAGVKATRTFGWTVTGRQLIPNVVPRVLGTLARGSTVTVAVASWRAPLGKRVRPLVNYQWYLKGKAIKGATGASFVIPKTAAYVGKALTVKLTVAKTSTMLGYSYTTARSAPVL